MEIIKKNDKLNLITLDQCNEIDMLYYELFKEYECTYLTYMIESENEKKYFSTNSDWQNEFTKNSLINHCPIYGNAFEAAKKNNVIFTAWDYVPHKKGEESDVMDLRSSFNIGHGLGLAIKNNNIRESLVFASTIKNSDFHKKIANKTIINKALTIFRKNMSNK